MRYDNEPGHRTTLPIRVRTSEGDNSGTRVEGKVAFITGAAEGRAAATPSGWPKRAPTSSPSTSVPTSTPSATQWPAPGISRRPRTTSRRPGSGSSPPRPTSGTGRIEAARPRDRRVRQTRHRRRAGRHRSHEGPAADAGLDRRHQHQLRPGTINAIQVALPIWPGGRVDHRDRLRRGADGCTISPTPAGTRAAWDTVSKRLISEYVHYLAAELAVRGIRANVIHPTNCNTDMLQASRCISRFRPDLENPTKVTLSPCSLSSRP